MYTSKYSDKITFGDSNEIFRFSTMAVKVTTPLFIKQWFSINQFVYGELSKNNFFNNQRKNFLRNHKMVQTLYHDGLNYLHTF